MAEAAQLTYETEARYAKCEKGGGMGGAEAAP